jgi:hypothetical protein
VNIAKREAKSNACVVDVNTGLMWLRDPSNYPAKMGAASDGKMEWTGKAYDIFAYCAACNAAAVGGYADWRVPNYVELGSLAVFIGAAPYENQTAFPNAPAVGSFYTSTTYPGGATASYAMRSSYAGYFDAATKTTSQYFVMLVRGGR